MEGGGQGGPGDPNCPRVTLFPFATAFSICPFVLVCVIQVGDVYLVDISRSYVCRIDGLNSLCFPEYGSGG